MRKLRLPSFLCLLLALLPACCGASSSSKPFSLLSPFLLNFHQHKPAVPDATATLEELEATVSDEFIANTIDQVTLDSHYSSPIILPYKPQGRWLWRRWHGTILHFSLTKVAVHMSIATLLSIALRSACGATWGWGMPPSPAECGIIAKLKAVEKLWHYQRQLTTFILTFFLTQAYQLWREMYKVARGIQGKLNDIGMLLATHASRRQQETHLFTESAQTLLATVARQLRLFHLLTWASQSRQFQVLLTNRGLTQLQQRGFLTPTELSTLLQLSLPPTARQTAVLEWIIMECNEAQQNGSLVDSSAVPKLLLQKICELRGTAASIGDLVDGRMPLAYAHLVQLLVDCFLAAAPLALYSELGIWSVLCVAFVTLFYAGLLDLAKIFLDPLNNEDYCEGSIDMDLGGFIRESARGSERWRQGLAILPNDMVGFGGTSGMGSGQATNEAM